MSFVAFWLQPPFRLTNFVFVEESSPLFALFLRERGRGYSVGGRVVDFLTLVAVLLRAEILRRKKGPGRFNSRSFVGEVFREKSFPAFVFFSTVGLLPWIFVSRGYPLASCFLFWEMPSAT